MTKFVHSFWSRMPIEQELPSLEGDGTADVVVVGGGMNGISTAMALRDAGLNVSLIERGAIGAQSSSKNFGTLTTVWDYSSLPLHDNQTIVRYVEGKIAALHTTLKQMGLGQDFEQENNWRIIKDEANHQLGQEEYTKARDAGYDCSFVPGNDVRVTSAPTHGAVRIKQWVVNPAQLMRDLRKLAVHKGIQIYEGTPAGSIEVHDRAVVVRTPGGKITAEKVVICVNGFTNSVGVDSLSHSLPIHIHALATRALEPELAAKIGTEFGAATDIAPREQGHKVYWQRLLPDGHLLFGGGQYSIPSPDKRLYPLMTERKAQSLIEELVRRYPFLNARDVDCFWSGAITGPAGEKPIIANVGSSGRVTVVQSCLGHGMGLAPAIGDAVLEHLRPGASGSTGAELLLKYAFPTPSFTRWAEGFVFRLLANTPLRVVANAMLKP